MGRMKRIGFLFLVLCVSISCLGCSSHKRNPYRVDNEPPKVEIANVVEDSVKYYVVPILIGKTMIEAKNALGCQKDTFSKYDIRLLDESKKSYLNSSMLPWDMVALDENRSGKIITMFAESKIGHPVQLNKAMPKELFREKPDHYYYKKGFYQPSRSEETIGEKALSSVALQPLQRKYDILYLIWHQNSCNYGVKVASSYDLVQIEKEKDPKNGKIKLYYRLTEKAKNLGDLNVYAYFQIDSSISLERIQDFKEFKEFAP